MNHNFNYLNPRYATTETAVEFDYYLAMNLAFGKEAFGDEYAWNDVVPARERWAEEVDALNQHLRNSYPDDARQDDIAMDEMCGLVPSVED